MRGYSALACLMADFPQLIITRRFKKLYIQNVLYVQAELTMLENAFLIETEKNENTQDVPQRYAATDWQHLSQPSPIHGAVNPAWQIFHLRIQKKLEEYHKAVRMASYFISFQSPSDNDLGILRSEIDSKVKYDLTGDDSRVWTDESLEEDLASVKRQPEFDSVSKWVIQKLLPTYHYYIGIHFKRKPNDDGDIYNYDEFSLRRPVRIVATLGASMIPTMAVITLFLVQSMMARLLVTAVFTNGFAFMLALLTDARPGDIFAATAA
jgi:hypothetical protein